MPAVSLGPDGTPLPRKPTGFLIAAIIGIGGGLVLATLQGGESAGIGLVVVGLVPLAKYIYFTRRQSKDPARNLGHFSNVLTALSGRRLMGLTPKHVW